jgi:diguanylate cyclase (GGDEF)-like protein
MISIRKYLDGSQPPPDSKASKAVEPGNRGSAADLIAVYLESYRNTLAEMARCGVDVCAATGTALESSLVKAVDDLRNPHSADSVAANSAHVRVRLQEWSHDTARHFQEKAGEMKEILLAMAQTTESVSQRDQRCADQWKSITSRLERIASLDDISAMRRAIETSAAELRTSIDRMTEQGRVVIDRMQAKMSEFQARLQEAEETASSDALTQLRSRLYLEEQLERRVAAGSKFCVALLDIDEFKSVNDTHGHVLGDELLRQFAMELRSACRSSDIVGRWGGDEFLVLLDCGIDHARAQMERACKWVCGSYSLPGADGPVKLNVAASAGLAEFTPPESMADLLARADAAMYQNKRAERTQPMTA